jgi:GT2 family glycosyltransferase
MMAAYNAARYIDQAVASVVAQVYADWELVAVDDGSVDETWSLLTAWAARDTRIRIFRNDRNEGLGTVRGRCLELARGEYAAVMDSDDVALPSWLTQRVSILESRTDAVLVSGPLQTIGELGENLGVRSGVDAPLVLKWQLLFANPINHPSAVFRTSAARQVGGYQSQPYLEDWSLCARLSELGQVVQDGVPRMKYRIHAGCASARLGPDKNVLESLARNIMARNLYFHTQVERPGNLTWCLFRGRYPFKSEPMTSRAALRFLCRVYIKFTALNPGSLTNGHLATAFLDDVANVLRTGGWTPGIFYDSVSVAFRPLKTQAILRPSCLIRVLKVLVVPLRTIRGTGPIASI